MALAASHSPSLPASWAPARPLPHPGSLGIGNTRAEITVWAPRHVSTEAGSPLGPPRPPAWPASPFPDSLRPYSRGRRVWGLRMGTFPAPTPSPPTSGPETRDPACPQVLGLGPPSVGLHQSCRQGPAVGRAPSVQLRGSGRQVGLSQRTVWGRSQRSPLPKGESWQDQAGCQCLGLQPCKPRGGKLRKEPRGAD